MPLRTSIDLKAIHAITATNRDSWNRIAPKREGERASLFRDGGSTLAAHERELAGDVTGKRILQLACSTGDEVLSWASLGAKAIGADISEVAIAKARRKAADAGIRAEFHCADMFDLPPDLADLDVIYLSWGAICWAPDLDVLAGIIAERLRARGSVLISDHHPLWEVLTVRGDNHLTITGDYFGRGTARNSPDAAKQPIGTRGESETTPFAAFVWPVSDVVMSLIRAGLRLDAFFEAPEPAIYAELGDAAVHIPAYYAIKATKTEPPRAPDLEPPAGRQHHRTTLEIRRGAGGRAGNEPAALARAPDTAVGGGTTTIPTAAIDTTARWETGEAARHRGTPVSTHRYRDRRDGRSGDRAGDGGGGAAVRAGGDERCAGAADPLVRQGTAAGAGASGLPANRAGGDRRGLLSTAGGQLVPGTRAAR